MPVGRRVNIGSDNRAFSVFYGIASLPFSEGKPARLIPGRRIIGTAQGQGVSIRASMSLGDYSPTYLYWDRRVVNRPGLRRTLPTWSGRAVLRMMRRLWFDLTIFDNVKAGYRAGHTSRL